MTSNVSSDSSERRAESDRAKSLELPPFVSRVSEGCVLRLFVQPKARKRQVVGLHLDRLKIAVTEPPDRGKANNAVEEFIAELLNVSRSRVSLLRGDTNRNKDLLIAELAPRVVADLLSKFML